MQKKYVETLKKYKWLLEMIMDKPIEEKSRNDIKLYGRAKSVPASERKKKKCCLN